MPSFDYIGTYRNPQTAAGGQTSLASGPTYNYDPRFGGNPTVPSPGGTQQSALSENISALGPLYQLGGGLNQFTAQQAPTSLNLNLPNYQQMLGASSGNILSKLQGQIPQDVVNQLGQLAAERGVSTGSIGSPNSNAALMRALGLTSLDLQNQGEQQFTGAVGRTPQGAQFNPYSFLVSPEQQQQAQYQANLLNAAPVPSSAQYAGLNALQAGRNAGYGGGFPSSGPMQQPMAAGPVYAGGQQPLGSTPRGSPSGSYSLTDTSGDFDAAGNYIGDLLGGAPTGTSGTPAYSGFPYLQQPYNIINQMMGLGDTMAYPGTPGLQTTPGQAPYSGMGYFKDPLYGGGDYTTPRQYEQLPSGEWDTTYGFNAPLTEQDWTDMFGDAGP